MQRYRIINRIIESIKLTEIDQINNFGQYLFIVPCALSTCLASSALRDIGKFLFQIQHISSGPITVALSNDRKSKTRNFPISDGIFVAVSYDVDSVSLMD